MLKLGVGGGGGQPHLCPSMPILEKSGVEMDINGENFGINILLQ